MYHVRYLSHIYMYQGTTCVQVYTYTCTYLYMIYTCTFVHAIHIIYIVKYIIIYQYIIHVHGAEGVLYCTPFLGTVHSSFST
jgi:hypothetical protein